MAGVPHHSIDTYLGRLVRKGYKVALCDQVEDARHAVGLVRREVTRVVTPGTVVEDGILGGPDHSFLASVDLGEAGAGGYSAVDVTTGEWVRGTADGPGAEGIVSALAGLTPREILYRSAPALDAELRRVLRREFPAARLEPAPSPAAPSEAPSALAAGFAAAGGPTATDLTLLAFLKTAQPRLLPHLVAVDRGAPGERLVLDARTLRHLEISRPMNPDDPNGVTLIGTWDATRTATGRRTLSFWLTNPLANVAEIEARLDAVAELVAHEPALERWRAEMGRIADLSRIASRVAGRRARPEELARLRDGLAVSGELAAELRTEVSGPLLGRLAVDLVPPKHLVDLLEKSVPAEVVGSPAPVDLLRGGYSPELDRVRAEESTAVGELSALERHEQEATGIKTLKVGYNQVFGHYFEVSRPNLERVPPRFRRRQTVAGGERYVSDELLAISDRLSAAREASRVAADVAWEELGLSVDREVGRIHRLARAVGTLDALAAFAHQAIHHRLVRPRVDDSDVLLVRGGRHPVLDRQLGERFVPNDVQLDGSERLLVLTGPNMSGKSTYMRQVGLLVVLAQAGSFVPAQFAHVGVVHELFTRMGFTDEIGRGKSSFMVEMSEVAAILHAAGPRSLVLLDEVGRGTSTFDGLAIAWATLRYLHNERKTRAILATHYHHLTSLVETLRGARNAHLAVQDRPEGIVFLHRLVPGATDRSYGIHVARLAGVPEPVLAEATRLLEELEAGLPAAPAPRAGARAAGRPTRYTQAVLLGSEEPDHAQLADELRRLDPEALSGEEAQAKLADLHRRAGGRGRPPS